jgi:hypothetical protein
LTLELAHPLGELPLGADEPDFPVIAQDRTPPKRESITTAEPRQPLFDDNVLPMLVGDDVFLKLVRKGVEQGAFVYRSGELLRANSLPQPGRIAFDRESELSIAAYAREHGIWPRPELFPPLLAASAARVSGARPRLSKGSLVGVTALVAALSNGPGPCQPSRREGRAARGAGDGSG